MKRLLLLRTQILRFDALKAKDLSYILAGAVTLAAAFSLWLFSPPSAFATSGAFINTKHGGGTVDGIKFDGINRAINPDYSLYYNDSTEGGQYVAGECTHCHEPHASFGVTEPPPNPTTGTPAGPTAYLLMEGNYNSATAGYNSKLCWYCHDNIFGGAGPGTGYWGYYKGNSEYQLSSHYLNLDGGSAMAWPGTGVAGDPWARQSRSTLPSANSGSCINCHTPHGVMDAVNTPGYDFAATQTRAGYEAGTDPTAAAKEIIPRQLIARQEALCLRCHDVDGPASTNIKAEVDNWAFIAGWDATQGSAHPVRAGSGATYNYYLRHNFAGLDGNASTTSDNEPPAYTGAGGWFTASSKHAECMDCHNPHAVRGVGSNSGGFWAAPWGGGVYQFSIGPTYNATGAWNTNRNASSTTDAAINLAAQNRGVWGVSVNTATGSITGIISSLQSWNDAVPNYVYNLCFKCHSAWAWGSGGTPGTNAPWNAPSSTRTFTASNGTGQPASRSNLSMTDQPWEFATNRVAYHPVFGQGKNQPDQAGVKNPCWCAGAYTCPPAGTGQTGYPDAGCAAGTGTRTDLTGNDIPTLSQNFVPPWRHTSRVTCTDCHENNSEANPRGPHGSTRPFILRRLDTTISYARTGMANCAYSTSNSCGSGILSTMDPDNFCLNCHRPDVYGWYNQTSSTTRLVNFPRQAHDTFNNGDAFGGNQPQNTPNGIVCMICHGGANNKLGTLHGNDYTSCQAGCPNDAAPCVSPTCNNSGRLIATTGVDAGSSEWIRWTKSSVGNAGSCQKGNSPYCGNTSDGNFDRGANYNY